MIAAVAARLGGNPDDWRPGRRCDALSRAVGASVARQTTNCTSQPIGAALGYRGASSISVACRRLVAALARNPALPDEIGKLKGDLATNH